MVGKIRKPVVFITGGAVLVAAGVVGVVLGTQGSGTKNTPLTDASRVLQSVDVTMAPNGDLTAVKGTVVGTTTDHKSFTNKNSYTPGSAQSQIPVRILTSYRTKDKTGTNLADLDGYTGPVQLQFTVQNLTVKARTVHYNVNGQEHTRSALVGVPMTVVASTGLPGVKPSAVRTKAADHFAATNGVLSQDAKGATQVQWATILAPPQLDASTTLTLALDAKKFKAPDFDLSVQPGLVTDPSIGSVIDAAFNPGSSSEMKLEQRTVDVVGKVTQVLGKANKTIARVRSTLNQSSQGLGTQTVQDLKDGTSGVADSVKGLSSSINSLGDSLSSSLNETKSQTLAELQQMVQTVNTMLGDTSAKPPKTTVSGTGCTVSVAKPKSAHSIYGTLLQVVSQLNAYAGATDQCKAEINTALGTSLNTVTSTLNGADQLFANIASDLSTTATDVANGITSNSQIATAVTQATDLNTYVDNLGSGVLDLTGAIGDYTNANNALSNIVTAINAVHSQAVSAHDALSKVDGDLATEICSLATAGSLSPADAATLRSYTSSTQCDNTTAVTTAPDGGQPIAAQVTNLQTLADLTDLNPADPTTGSALYTATTAARSALSSLALKLPALALQSTSLSAALQGKTAALQTAVTAVNTALAGTASAAKTALDNASAQTKSAGDDAVSHAITTVTDQSTSSQSELGQMFALSEAGLTAAAGQISTDGAAAIQKQKAQFADQEKASGKNVSSAVGEGLSEVSQSVSGSTKDLASAQKLLVGDLQNVLLDLGTPSVKGSGLLGAMATSSSTANAANYQLALASRAASAYGNVRGDDIASLLLRQAQTDEALTLEAQLPAFQLHLPASAEHHTVYSFHVRAKS